jgi:predicted ATPase/DNA-binding winged helix-turn-helix (wHTH) protein
MNTRDTPTVAGGDEMLTFGPFQLDLRRRVLQAGLTPLDLNKRTLEILVALTERAGEVLNKRELLERALTCGPMQDGVLRVHIARLRKILGCGTSGRRYMETIPGRGYRFVARVRREKDRHPAQSTSLLPPSPATLPALLTPVVGRAQALSTLAQCLKERRFVCVTGPGGVGKSTVAVALAAQLRERYPDGVRYLDLSVITAGRLVQQALAGLLGLEDRPNDPTSTADMLMSLRHKSLLILLDNCEHLHAAVADLAERLLAAAAGVHILATSRRPLRAPGEHVLHIAPLPSPAEPTQLTLAQALAFPAIQLFVERAMAAVDTFELTPAAVPPVAQVCHRLDGNPLAIELAAARLDIFGLRDLTVRLGDSLSILVGGQRTAPARHRSLRASLDWSYNLLAPSEQRLLRRLALFTGNFGVEAASQVAADEHLSRAQILNNLSALAAQSLLSADASRAAVLYRLPQCQREYALEKLRASGEETRVRRRYVQLWPTAAVTRQGVPGSPGGSRYAAFRVKSCSNAACATLTRAPRKRTSHRRGAESPTHAA